MFCSILAHFCPNLVAMALGSLEILDSIFEIADLENPTVHSKFVSIFCTKMKLCLFECLAYLYRCRTRVYAIFSIFAKNNGNC